MRSCLEAAVSYRPVGAAQRGQSYQKMEEVNGKKLVKLPTEECGGFQQAKELHAFFEY